MLLEKKCRLVLAGDSITDCGRARPVGEGMGDALGNGYATLVDAILRVQAPGWSVRVTNMGVSGDTSRGLWARWQTDVLDLAPDWVTVLIGINDVWRHFDSPLQPERHVGLAEYRDNLRQMVETALPVAKGVLLMTPYYLEPNRADAMRAKMDDYGAVVKALAGEYKLPLVDVQAAFDRFLEHHYSAVLAWDRVHPNLTGHLLIARALCEGLGLPAWPEAEG